MGARAECVTHATQEQRLYDNSMAATSGAVAM